MGLEIGRAIRIIRAAKRMRIHDLARAARVSAPYLSMVENGDRQPSLEVIRSLAAAMQVPPEALLVLAQPTRGRLTLTDLEAKRIAESVRKLARAEEKLRSQLGHMDASNEAE